MSDTPTRPALRYFGGKWRLASWVISHLPPHRCYVEPFMGGASVLLRKPRSAVEILNDRADLVVNFFRVVRDQGDELRRRLEATPYALTEFRACGPSNPDIEPIERARQFFVRCWGAFHGMSCHHRSTGWRRSADRDAAGDMAAAADGLEAIQARLRRVSIENLDYSEILTRYDRQDTCFYIDPPYVRSSRRRPWPCSGYGEHDWTDDQHVELLDRLQATAGAVVLSGYPSDLYDQALDGWQVLNHHRGRERLWIKPGTAAQLEIG